MILIPSARSPRDQYVPLPEGTATGWHSRSYQTNRCNGQVHFWEAKSNEQICLQGKMKLIATPNTSSRGLSLSPPYMVLALSLSGTTIRLSCCATQHNPEVVQVGIKRWAGEGTFTPSPQSCTQKKQFLIPQVTCYHIHNQELCVFRLHFKCLKYRATFTALHNHIRIIQIGSIVT